mmetsp:Transcript_92808/g.276870  ORF Transcript_92808/g.276870 Transcript_92808/m.276870 type:complete len:424 (+) Transcript_92808:136-1407(+)
MVRHRLDAASVCLSSNPRNWSCSARLAPGGSLPGGGGGGAGVSGTGTSGGDGRSLAPVAPGGDASPGCVMSHSSPSSTVSACFTAAKTASVRKPIFASSAASWCFCRGTLRSRTSALRELAVASASSSRRSVRGDTSLGVGPPSPSPAPSSSFSFSSWSLANFLPGATVSFGGLPALVLSARKSAASSRNHAGRTPLCPPSKTRSARSPAHASCRSWVWCGSTKVSSDATPKKAGHTAFGADLIGVSSSGSKAALAVTSARTISRAQLSRNPGTGNLPRPTNSSATVRRSRKAESRTQAARSWSSAARRMEVVAPMDRPQRPIAVTLSRPRRCCSTTRRSLSSWWPREMYSPSDRPEPDRSRQKTVRPRGSRTGSASKASRRDEQFPWRYTTQGRLASGVLAGTKWLHSSTPLLLLSCRSLRS